MNYVAYFDLGDGHGERGPYALRSALPDEYYCSESFKRAVSQYRISMLPDLDFLAAHAAATGDTVVRILANDILVFKGRAAPTDSWTSNGASLDGSADLSDFEFEVLDYSSYLDREIKDDDGVVWEAHAVCSATESISIVHKLLALCGIAGDLFVPTTLDETVLAAFAPDPGSVIGDVLDSLLYQYGLILRWNVDHFEISPWLIESPVSALNINEDIVMTGLKTERTGREADGVEVLWYGLKTKTGCLLAKPYLAFEDDGSFSKYPVEPGLLWPEEANVDATWFDYEDTALSTTVSSDGLRQSENKDFTQIVLTKNHRIDAIFDAGLVPAFSPIFENKRARLAYSNPTASILYIDYCLLYGDVIYRGAENAVTKNSVNTPRNTTPYTAEYIHSEAPAIRLACAIAGQYGTGCWRSSFNSETRINLGVIGTLHDPYSGYSGLVRITKRSFDPDSGIYSYRAISIAPVSIVPTAKYQAVLAATPPTSSSEKTAAEAKATATAAATSASSALSRAYGYLGPFAVPPETAELNECYFDTNSAALGGGVIRYFTGAAWGEATAAWKFYAQACWDALPDMGAWATEQDSVIAAASAIFQKLVTADAFIANLFAININMTGRLRLYEGIGTQRRCLQIKDGRVGWLDTPDTDPASGEILRASFGRLGVAGAVLMDGEYYVAYDGGVQAMETIDSSNYTEGPLDSIWDLDGKRRILARVGDSNLKEWIQATDGTWSGPNDIGTAYRGETCGHYFLSKNGTLYVIAPASAGSYWYNLCIQVYDRSAGTWGFFACVDEWGTEGVLYEDEDLNLHCLYGYRPNVSSGYVLKDRTYVGGVFGNEYTVPGGDGYYPQAIIGAYNKNKRYIARMTALSGIYEGTIVDGTPSAPAQILDLAMLGFPQYLEDIDGNLYVFILATGTLSAYVLSGGAWVQYKTYSAITPANATCVIPGASGNLEVYSYSDATLRLKRSLVMRYTKLSNGIVKRANDANNDEYIVLGDGTTLYTAALKTPIWVE